VKPLFMICAAMYAGRMQPEPVEDHVVSALVAEALMRSAGFGSRRRHWAATSDADWLQAKVCADAIVQHLRLCGIRWLRLPPAPPHSIGE
jgi:hypothetical protein